MFNQNIQNNLKLRNSKKRGFTLLFAVLVSVLVLAIGASMVSIALKQIILSGSGRESQFAFYAANTGIECALYWDLNILDDSGDIKYTFPTGPQVLRNDWGSVTCNGGQIHDGVGYVSNNFTEEIGGYNFDTTGETYTFRMTVNNTVSGANDILYCTEVTVGKILSGNLVKTTITSRGLNTCDPDGNARAVERALVLEYFS